MEGGTRFNETVNLQAIPIYIKAGSIIPKYDFTACSNTETLTNEHLSLHYYPSNAKTHYTLYQDDGKSKNAITTHQYELINIEAQTLAKNQGYQFTIQSNKGNYIGKPAKQVYTLVIHQSDRHYKNVLINGIKQQLKLSGSQEAIKVQLTFTGVPLKVEILP